MGLYQWGLSGWLFLLFYFSFALVVFFYLLYEEPFRVYDVGAPDSGKMGYEMCISILYPVVRGCAASSWREDIPRYAINPSSY